MTSTDQAPTLLAFIDDLHRLVETYKDERIITIAVAERLRSAIADGIDLPRAVTVPNNEHYVMYPLYVDPAGRFSIASAVWNVGQGTPVHGHETWGVVGIYSGTEHEIRFVKPKASGRPLARKGSASWSAGEVTVCCTTDDDVHQVFCEGDNPCVGIHVYGTDIGTISRRAYQPDTGEVTWFVSGWTDPAQAANT